MKPKTGRQNYIERVQLYFMANDIMTPGKIRSVLLSVCEAQTYHTICDIVAQTKSTDFTYDEMVTRVQEHYNPTPVVTVQQFKFNSRSRQPDESVATFLAALQHLPIHCE